MQRDEKGFAREWENSVKTVAILQSNYIPWKGYFDLIASADEFIIYDDMQFTRRDWRNRNVIKTPQGLLWLTIPVKVKGKYHQTIRETEVENTSWALSHWKSIAANYSKAAYFEDIAQWLEPIYRGPLPRTLTEINQIFMAAICQYLGIQTRITCSWDYELTEGKSERLADLCVQARATHYLTGPAAKSYLDENIFAQRQLQVKWFDYMEYKEYKQFWGEFNHFVSILDLLFHCGKQAPSMLKGLSG